MVERSGAEVDEHLAGPRLGIRRVLVAQNLRPAVLVDPDCLHPADPRHNAEVTTAELERLAAELGIDVVGAAPAEPYDETERHIRERRARGLFADMRFTMARPEVSCHPETLLPGARSVISAALCYYATSPSASPAKAGCRATRGSTRYAELREKLDALGRRLGGEYRVLVDENDHVDREAGARAGVGFYGKNTMLITRRHGSWVVLGTLVTDAELERLAPLELDCGSARSASRRARRAPSTSRACSTRPAACRTGRRRRRRFPRSTARSSAPRSTAATSARTSARGTAASRSGARRARPSSRTARLARRWLELGDDELRTRYERLYFPRKTRATSGETRLSRSEIPATPSTDPPSRPTPRRRPAPARARAVGSRAAGRGVL